MPTKAYSRPWPGRPGVELEHYANTWESNMDPVTKRVVLRDSAHSYWNAKVTSYGGTDAKSSCNGANSVVAYEFTESDLNKVKARLSGKLHRGDASMGMTLATCGQSAAMLLGRFQQISDLMGMTRRRRARRALRPRTSAKSLASDVLEVEFGWRPFIEDIASCMTTLCSETMPPVRFRASNRIQVNTTQKSGGEPSFLTVVSGRARVTACQSYSVSNPNVWLLNQLGLLNPFEVAWDRVPWSWVVNMFVNANQLIGSFSDTFGLTLLSGSMTTSSALFREQTETWNNAPWKGWRYFANTNCRRRTRTGLSSLMPTLEFRLPNVNWELAMIASALCVQRSKSLS